MKSFDLSNETGWVTVPGDTEIVVAHFKDGHTEKMSVVGFLTMRKNLIKRIDCYKKGEAIQGNHDEHKDTH